MSYEFLKLNLGHQNELLELFHHSKTGNNDFMISRDDDFFALADEMGKATYYGVMKDKKLQATIGITEQYRYINREKQKCFYMHDLRIHPIHGTAFSYLRLIEGMTKIYRNDPECKWMFSVILEANSNAPAITKGKFLFPAAGAIGTIVHVGFPLFFGSKINEPGISRINADEAWEFYQQHARHIGFSLADEQHFKNNNGFFLGVKNNNRLTAICKITDQQAVRKIISCKPLSVSQKLINLWCRFKKYKGLPAKDEVFAHCYLSYYTSVSETDYRKKIVSWMRVHYAQDYCYVFTGMLPTDAKKVNEPLNIQFNSHVYGYGNVPAAAFQFPELTLI